MNLRVLMLVRQCPVCLCVCVEHRNHQQCNTASRGEVHNPFQYHITNTGLQFYIITGLQYITDYRITVLQITDYRLQDNRLHETR